MSIRAVLGTFDGVHLGHRVLFARARRLSQDDGMPILALVIRREGEAITSTEERVELLEREGGADLVHVLPLSEVRHMSAEQFALYIKEEFGVGAAVCGDDFRFGRDRLGDAAVLMQYMPTEVVGGFCLEGERVSSTRIRTRLREGDVEGAARLMDRPFTLSGRVVHGKSLGATRGYPTANISYPDGAVPVRRGVYLTRVRIGSESYNALSNVGVCPTVSGEDTVVESFLLDFCASLYEEEIKVELLRFLRPEERFPDLDALYAQIARDMQAAKEYFKG